MNNTIQTDAIGLTALILVGLSYVGFALAFLLRKKPPRAPEAKRNRVSALGIAIEVVAFALVWAIRRPRWWPFPPSTAGELALATAAVAITVVSGLWCIRAIQTLGKHWTYEARITTDHELVTTGPYSVVRNPIYLGLFGLLIGVGLALSRWWALAAGVVTFLIGNHIRIRSEEALLRGAFGPQFDDYAARVPAFFPGLRKG
jgi:protein-S-isoprenylcysteine O-methyltransferase Ste14